MPRFETWDGAGSAADFVWSLNFTRRHLDGGARQIAAGRYSVEIEREARERQGTRTDLTLPPNGGEVEFGRSAKLAADKFDVAERTVERAVTVLKQGVPELVAAVERDEVSVSAAADVARLPQDEQREIVDNIRSGIQDNFDGTKFIWFDTTQLPTEVTVASSKVRVDA